MSVSEICPPAFIYLCFSLTQITIDTIKGEHNKALFKLWITIIFTLLLNNMCSRGLGMISWIIIMMPFMLMSIITTILLYVFGFDPTTGKLKYYTPDGEDTIGVDARGRIGKEEQNSDSSYARPVDLIEHKKFIPQESSKQPVTSPAETPSAEEPSAQQPSAEVTPSTQE